MIDPSTSADTPRPGTNPTKSDEKPTSRRGRRTRRPRRDEADSSSDDARSQPDSTTDADPSAGSTDSPSSEARRPRRRRRRRNGADEEAPADAPRKKTRASSASKTDADATSEPFGSIADEEPPAKKTRTRRKTKASTRASGDAATEEAEAPARPAKKRTRRRKKVTTDKADKDSDAADGAAGDDAAAEGEERPKRRKRSRRSTKKRTTKSAAKDAGEDDAPAAADAEGDTTAEAGEGKKRSRRRGSRGGRRRRRSSEDEEERGAAVGIEIIPGEDHDELPEIAELPEDAVLISGEGGERKGRRSKRVKASKKTRAEGEREKKRGSRSKKSRAEEVEEAPKKKRQILVNAVDPEETRVCVLEDGVIVDLQMSVKKQVSFVHDIYRGRVVNLEPAIGAAFVDFGQGRNGFLHASDVLPSYGDPDWSLEKLLSTPLESDEDGWEDGDGKDAEEPEPPAKKGKAKTKDAKGRRGRPKRQRLPIEKLVKKGQMIVAQITKDAIGDKGPTLTTYVSIPGRYLVLMPSLERTGVSRKIEDDRERRRLKRILSSLEIPDGMGVIVRTAGIGKTKSEIKRDLDYLLLAWSDFSKRLVSGRNPMPLYQESDVAIRTMRDLFTTETESVVVDDPDEYERMVAFTKKLMPEFVDRVKLHEGMRPLLHTQGVEQDFEKIFARRVELPSGGSIVIDQTEALVAIDVNSGRTREKGAEFEDIALKTNLEAAPEIARQIRLRDLGGIIVLDYIDMMKAANRRAVERATRGYLKEDRARSKIGSISQFGLLEMTRQRLGPGLSKLVYDTCRRCRGSGRQRSASSRAQAILRRLGTALTLKGFTSVEVRAHPEVIEYLKTNLSAEMADLEKKSTRKLSLVGVPDQVEDSVLHYLRADGREVRPGGRRKR